jgi:thioredoxin reductase (NADPH)
VVALVLAAQRMTEMSGVEFLAAAHELHPAAKRVLLVERGDYSAAHPAVRAMTAGQIDYHLFVPWQPAERWLYPPLSLATSWRPGARRRSRRLQRSGSSAGSGSRARISCATC